MYFFIFLDKCKDKPKVDGLCMANFRRYSYIKKSNSCEEFGYGGCGGNLNRFSTLEACKNECVKSTRQETTSTELIEIFKNNVTAVNLFFLFYKR